MLREYELAGGSVSGTWSETDTVHRDGRVLAVVSPTETQHASLDHLGTPRLWTGPGGVIRRRPEHLPYGEPAVTSNQKFQFTGHERDERGNGTTDDLDYMHARYYSPHLGRFLGVDPLLASAFSELPQSWNRYSYVLGQPMDLIDPFGLAAIDSCQKVEGKEYEVSCEGSTTVTAAAPDRESPTYDPLTGVNGLGYLISGSSTHRSMTSFNDMRSLPPSMHGMSFDEAVFFAASSGAGGDCSADANCLLLAEVATALENPLYRTIVGSQEAGLMFLGGGAGAASTGLRLRFLRYSRAGGGGLNLYRGSRRAFAIDWHRFKLSGQTVNRLHYHAGRTKNQLKKHRPWQGGWRWF